MVLHNPYTHKCIEYELDLDINNVVKQCFIEHETFFCPWHIQWSVLYLRSGDVIYFPYGSKNKGKNIYVVTSYYLNKQIEFPYGVYTIEYTELVYKCSKFINEMELLSSNSYVNYSRF